MCIVVNISCSTCHAGDVPKSHQSRERLARKIVSEMLGGRVDFPYTDKQLKKILKSLPPSRSNSARKAWRSYQYKKDKQRSVQAKQEANYQQRLAIPLTQKMKFQRTIQDEKKKCELAQRSVKELKGQNELLEKKVNELETQNNTLENELKAIQKENAVLGRKCVNERTLRLNAEKDFGSKQKGSGIVDKSVDTIGGVADVIGSVIKGVVSPGQKQKK